MRENHYTDSRLPISQDLSYLSDFLDSVEPPLHSVSHIVESRVLYQTYLENVRRPKELWLLALR